MAFNWQQIFTKFLGHLHWSCVRYIRRLENVGYFVVTRSNFRLDSSNDKTMANDTMKDKISALDSSISNAKTMVIDNIDTRISHLTTAIDNLGIRICKLESSTGKTTAIQNISVQVAWLKGYIQVQGYPQMLMQIIGMVKKVFAWKANYIIFIY